jgi:three-Cys-motif partner protein
LTLAFVDPEGMHVHFDTLRTLTHDRKVDLAVLFADRMDIVRNVQTYFGQADSKLDQFLGPDSDWRSKWMSMGNQDAVHTCQLFGDIYKTQLRQHLKYVEFRDRVFASSRSALYRVIYASKHKLGAKLYEEISRIDRRGQRDLPFSD